MPDGTFRRPRTLDPTSLTVSVVAEGGGEVHVYDFGDLERTPLLESLVAAFAVATSTTGSWATRITAARGRYSLRRFYKHLRARPRAISTIEDLTPIVWAGWRSELLGRSAAPGALHAVRSLLLHYGVGVPADTLREMRRVRNGRAPRRGGAYSPTEFDAIKQAAWHTVESAAERIRASITQLDRYRAEVAAELEQDPVRRAQGELLASLDETGALPPRARVGVGLVKRGYRSGVPPLPRAYHALFLTYDEYYAFEVLFAAICAYNASVVRSLTIKHHRVDGGAGGRELIALDLYKARRPVASRHVADVLVGGSPRSAASLYVLALDLTEPARRVLASLGRTTDRLLVARSATPAPLFAVDPQLNTAPGRWAAAAGITGDDGQSLVPTLPRLRLTEIALNAKPRQHSPATLDRDYLLPEPTVRSAATHVIVAGQQDALDHARTTVQMRAWSPARFEKARHDPDEAALELGVPRDKVDRLLAGALDTALGGCLDFDHSPFSRGGTCTASFLLCLACPNALATPSHLPRLLCLRDALADLATAVPAATWKTDYADHFARVTSLLESNTTGQEQAAARLAITSRERTLVADLLERRLDA